MLGSIQFNRESTYSIFLKGVIGPQDLHSAVKLSHKSISNLLQLHKEYHSLALSIDMRGLWGYILDFYLNLEWYYVQKQYILCSVLLAQAKDLMERRHKRITTELVECFYRERGNRWDISAKSLYFLIRMLYYPIIN